MPVVVLSKSTVYNPDAMNIQPVSLSYTPVPGRVDARAGPFLLQALRQSVAACQTGTCRGLVTGPINKAVINQAGIAFTGHTQWLAQETGTNKVVMMLASDSLRVALVTTHLPLAEVPSAITFKNITETITLLSRSLQEHFGIKQPTLLVCGLNPHAGEQGYLGTEEIEVIQPALAHLRIKGHNLIGPLPADTAFTPKQLANADAVVAMYHDQGLPVLKHLSFGSAVNITLGLPIIRTSVDHGTALDLAGTGEADYGSLLAAISMADRMSESANTNQA
jgi:4-hydroxythreonine-4-phosphate dehydrogenase